jgi:hypothetical protein
MKKLPKGADQQGRYPEAAETATDVGQDDSPREDVTWFWVVVLGIFVGVVLAAAWERAV